MRQYEVTFIVDPVLSGDEIKSAAGKYSDMLKENGCKIVHIDEMGLRQLAYPINRRSSGIYYCIEFQAETGEVIGQLELSLKRDDNILRFLTVALDKYGVKYNEDKRAGLIGKKKKKEKEESKDGRRSRSSSPATAKKTETKESADKKAEPKEAPVSKPETAKEEKAPETASSEKKEKASETAPAEKKAEAPETASSEKKEKTSETAPAEKKEKTSETAPAEKKAEASETASSEKKEKTSETAPAEKKAETSETAPAEKKAEVNDDLKKVEGIGPKIEEILNAAGITSFAGLAEAGADKVNDILAEAGDRYKAFDPTTWPNQADLAAKGNWDELKELQDKLDGGREVQDSSEEE